MESKITAALGEELCEACVTGDLDAIKAFISRHQAANDAYPPPWPALMYTATSKDHASIVQYCLDNGAQVTDDVVKILLINRSKETYTLLLDAKAIDINYYIPWFGDVLGNVATDDDREWTGFCLRRGADPNKNLRDEHKTLLAAVAELASVETVKMLVEDGGAAVRGSGAIIMAAEEGKLDMVKYLLDNGADINEVGIEHPTDERYKEDMGSALHKAVGGGHEDVVRFLLDKGADVSLKDPLGRTPMILALPKNNAGIVELLKAYGAVE